MMQSELFEEKTNINEVMKCFQSMDITALISILNDDGTYHGLSKVEFLRKLEIVFRFFQLRGTKKLMYEKGICTSNHCSQLHSKGDIGFMFFAKKSLFKFSMVFKLNGFEVMDISTCKSCMLLENNIEEESNYQTLYFPVDDVDELLFIDRNYEKLEGVFYESNQHAVKIEDDNELQSSLDWLNTYVHLRKAIADEMKPQFKFETIYLRNVSSIYRKIKAINKRKSLPIKLGLPSNKDIEQGNPNAHFHRNNLIEKATIKIPRINNEVEVIISLLINKDFEKLAEALHANRYNDFSKHDFIDKLKTAFEKFHKNSKLSNHLGYCTSCLKGFEGFSIIDIKGNHINLAFEVKDNKVVDISDCSGLTLKEKNILRKERIRLDAINFDFLFKPKNQLP